MKKQLILYFLFLLGFYQISAQTEQAVILTIDVSNQTSYRVEIQGVDMISRGIVQIDSNGIGADTLNLKQGVYNLIYGDNTDRIYLTSGGKLSISFDALNRSKSISFKGEGSGESRYLIDKDSNNYKALLSRTYLLEEAAFLSANDSIYQSNLNRLSKAQSSLNEDFIYWALGELKYQTLFNKQRYEMLRKYKAGFTDFEVSDSFPKVLDKLNLNESKLASIFYYTNLVESYVRKQIVENDLKNDSADYYYLFLSQLDALVPSAEVKSEVAYWNALNYLTKTAVPELYIKKVRALIIDSLQLNFIEERFQKVILTQKGKPSPEFRFKNQKGKTVSLAHLKGKVVYIDIWATWCVPCMNELPHLDNLQKDYAKKDIVFVSIARNDTKARWQKMIKEKAMGGIQLFAEDSDDPFFIDYSISSIPRFILLDKKLNIVDAQAKRPSNQSLRDQLNELLDKN